VSDDGNEGAKVYLQLAPGQSLIVRTMRSLSAADGTRGIVANATDRELTSRQIQAAAKTPWPYREIAGTAVPISGSWTITFAKGGPAIPASIKTPALDSWAKLGDDEAKRFGGTARYIMEFERPTENADDWLLDLGDVRESARVRLNGMDVAIAWSLPFQVRVGEFLKPGKNLLELDVTNLAANRIRDLDQRKVPWKIMREINFVNINYRPFDASNWPLTPSGLLGPVTLVPLKALKP
jgi:hypothetical protein